MRPPLLLLPLALAACGPVNRGLETTHQPIVRDDHAAVPGCPDWSQPIEPDLDSHTSSNFGCANATNLAAMVADPRDLLAGRSAPDAGADPFVAAKALKAWREAPPTGVKGLEKIIGEKPSNGGGQ